MSLVERMKILIVDGAPQIRLRLAALITEIMDADQISMVSKLKTAIQAVRNNPPEIIVMDLKLRDGNSIDMIPALKQQAPDAHIAILTNDSSDIYRRRCLQSGVDSFFDKSSEFDELLALIIAKLQNQNDGVPNGQ